jgi:hypothetical protein
MDRDPSLQKETKIRREDTLVEYSNNHSHQKPKIKCGNEINGSVYFN